MSRHSIPTATTKLAPIDHAYLLMRQDNIVEDLESLEETADDITRAVRSCTDLSDQQDRMLATLCRATVSHRLCFDAPSLGPAAMTGSPTNIDGRVLNYERALSVDVTTTASH